MTASNLQLTFREGGTGDAGDPYTGLDRFGRLVETLWKQPSTGDPRVQSKYGRNQANGVVWRKDEQAHAADVATEDNYYWYDALQQVKERQRGDLTDPASPAPISDLQQQENLTYDATGNWAAYSDTSPTNALTRTHNKANEITEIASSPGEVEPAYDPAGNMLTMPKQPGLSAEQYDLTWDAWNRLVAVKEGETTVASYTYDGLTRRLTKTNPTETRHYYYNTQWRALEERVEGASITVDRQYTWGLRDRWDLLRRKRSVSASLDEALYVLRDYLDPVAIVDDSGDVVERYAYDAFGNVRFLAPDYSSLSGSAFGWDFLFHAEFLDSDTSLYNYGYRYYDTGLGRWLSRDPIGEQGGLNLYAFAENCGVNAVDYLGLIDSQCKCGKEIGTQLQTVLNKLTDKLKNSPDIRAWVCTKAIFINKVNGWDIEELFTNSIYLEDETNKCGTGTCAKTASVNGHCYDQAGINYVLFGALIRMCSIPEDVAYALVKGWRAVSALTGQALGLDSRMAWTRMGYQGTLTFNDSIPSRVPSTIEPSATMDYIKLQSLIKFNEKADRTKQCPVCPIPYTKKLHIQLNSGDGQTLEVKS